MRRPLVHNQQEEEEEEEGRGMRTPHVVLFPYPLQGHINPMECLGRHLAAEGIQVTLVHSATNFATLPPSGSHALLRREAIPDHQPAPAATPSDLHSMRRLEPGLLHLLRSLPAAPHAHPVSCLVADMLMPWTRDLASQFRIPWIPLSIFPALSYAIAYHIPDLIAKGYLPLPPSHEPGIEEELIDFLPGLAPFRVADIPTDCLVHDLTHLQVIMRIFPHVNEAAGLLVNSCHDLEASTLEAIRAQLQIPIYPIGPLILCSTGCRENLPISSLLPEDVECLKWLDDQADSSVVYVAFGSLASHSTKEIQELALGLEASQQHFLWVIRFDSVNGDVPDILPEGFRSRTKDTGLIISWAPQLAVLSHRSIGGFFTHCGWNSVLESLWMGIPMIGCPKLSDQSTILKLLIDWKVGMALEDPGKIGVTREAVEVGVRALMHGEEAQEAKRRAMELGQKMRQAVLKGGDSHATLQKFVEHLQLMIQTPRSEMSTS